MARPGMTAAPPRSVVTGIARTDRRTKDLIARLQRGDIAVIDHLDLDRVAAEGLVEAGVSAVINASRSISGRYPNVGPMLIAAAGIMLIDGVGPGTLDRIPDGSEIHLEDGRIRIGADVVAAGTVQTLHQLSEQVEAAKATIGAELARFAENTLEYMQAEQYLLLESPTVPDLAVDVRGRHVLIVVRGDQFREDLHALTGYIRNLRPVIIAVDGGADAVLAAGHRPDIIVGDFDSVSTASLHCGAQLIVHAYPDGRAPGAARLDALGSSYSQFALAGTSEDIAMIMAYEKGADLIVAVGTHVSLVDFLDKGRPGMASTFLTRLKVGPILVDAKGVNKLYQAPVRRRDLALLVMVALLVFAILLFVAPPFRLFLDSLRIAFREWRK